MLTLLPGLALSAANAAGSAMTSTNSKWQQESSPLGQAVPGTASCNASSSSSSSRSPVPHQSTPVTGCDGHGSCPWPGSLPSLAASHAAVAAPNWAPILLWPFGAPPAPQVPCPQTWAHTPQLPSPASPAPLPDAPPAAQCGQETRQPPPSPEGVEWQSDAFVIGRSQGEQCERILQMLTVSHAIKDFIASLSRLSPCCRDLQKPHYWGEEFTKGWEAGCSIRQATAARIIQREMAEAQGNIVNYLNLFQ